MTGELPRIDRGRRATRGGRLDVGGEPARRKPAPERLQAVLDRAESVIAETRRVIRSLLRDLERQKAATRQVLTGQPRVQRRRRRLPRRRPT